MQSHDPGAHRDAIELVLAAAGAESVRGASVRFEADHQALVEIAHGWATQVQRFAAAVLSLCDQGFALEARVLARSVLEYTVTLHWVVKRGRPAVDAVMEEHRRWLGAVASTASSHGLQLPDRILGDLERMEPVKNDEVETLRRFIRVCEELGVGGLYLSYRDGSSTTHPTLSAASRYSEGDEESLHALRLDPEDDGQATVAVVAHLLIWALNDLDTLLTDRPLEPTLTAAAERIGTSRAFPE